jgi:hypothetical protein
MIMKEEKNIRDDNHSTEKENNESCTIKRNRLDENPAG